MGIDDELTRDQLRYRSRDWSEDYVERAESSKSKGRMIK